MDYVFIIFAFICGLGVRLLKLPPLIGFLAAGFVLHFLGFEANQSLHALADLGITLLLFTIGLKLNVRGLLKREVWLGSTTHMVLWTSIAVGLVSLAAAIGLPYLDSVSLQEAALLGFALSFSSTVCIVKILEEAAEMQTRHGRLAVGILIMQDIAAVVFLVLATGKVPSIYALGLLALIPLRPLLTRLLQMSGHGELLPLTGFFLALGGYELFELVGVKGDLGALIVGVLLSGHTKSAELNKALMNFKDLFLIGFFLTIGFTAIPNLPMLLMALGLTLVLPIKFWLFFFLFTGLRLRGRTAYLCGMALANFSEFGLIVVALSVDMGWLAKEWLVILALAVSLSFILTSVSYQFAHSGYSRWHKLLNFFERRRRLPEDVYQQPKGARVLVLGMGRVGKGAFMALRNVLGDQVWGLDADSERVARQKKAGLQVMLADGEDADLWENLDLSEVEMLLIALPSVDDIKHVQDQLKSIGYSGKSAAIARYEDERRELLDYGIEHVFNFYTEAGSGFAEESLNLIEKRPIAAL
ncbi:K(+) efflux antiporter 3, chloroplastic [Saliniradius amylolyticus]|uniref:K(+) efflux antiporter 3, chloroplastic n=1 Tax=Saliniradius amylolyticus TaxID=2183582 RepID=A0A2S2E2S6_9ALTE|nr:cation:proton antiporter [Saliniradius amylolyticus]AWL11948.1 K(+) efflux antiporter 3, chloroplastic [Saliniradius amylolyticus]